jgi:hypothetical protein
MVICRDGLLKLAKEKKVYLEGNILKVLTPEDGDPEFTEYLELCKQKDADNRRKRMEVAKEVQQQNKDLIVAAKENEQLTQDLKIALGEAEKLRDNAMQDLELLQQKTQFELVGTIVRIALGIIVGVGVLTTIMYIISISTGQDTQIIGSTWSNMFGILLTNAFSIVGTIMGVKYATEKQ